MDYVLKRRFLFAIRSIFLYSFLFSSPQAVAHHVGNFAWWWSANLAAGGPHGFATLAECVAYICRDLPSNCSCNQTSTNTTPSSISSIPNVSVHYIRTAPPPLGPPGSACTNSHEEICAGGYTPFSGNCTLNKQWQANGELQIATSGADTNCGVTVTVPQAERPCGKKSGSNQVGNPINCASGVKTQTEVDYRSSGPHPLTVERHYSSFQFNQDGSTSPYLLQTMRLQENEYAIRFQYNTGLQVAEISWPDGGHYAFDLANTSGAIGYSDRADKGYMQRNVSFIDYFDITGKRYRFDNNGRLSSIMEPDGYTRTISYTTSTSNIITTISDSFGRTLTYSYSGTLISSIQIPGGGLISYTYEFFNPSQRRLVSAIYPDSTPSTDADNPRRLYHYEDTRFPEALTGITDENGIRFATWSYDSQGRAISSEHAGEAEKVTLNYTSATETEVKFYRTSSDYRQSIYTHQTLNGRQVITEIETSPCSNCTIGTETRQYGSDGYLQSQTDANGNVTQYVHNTRGLETSRTEAYGTPLARTITTTWHANFNSPTLITEPGRTVGFTYDTAGNMLTRTETDTTVTPNVSRTTTYTYNGFGQVLTVDGPRTDVTDLTTYAYNSAGNLASITNALNQQTQFTSYDAHGNPLTIIDPNGATTTLTYDARQNLLARTVAVGTADATTTSFEYYPTNKLKKIIRPDGSFILYSYDTAQRLTQIEDNLGNYIRYTLDVAGNRTEENVYDPSDILVKTQTSVFNNLSRLIETIGGASQSTDYAHDANGNLTGITDPNTNTTTNTFDALNRLIKTVDPQNGSSNPTEYAYDPRDNLTAVEDPRGLTTQYQYNGFNEVIQQTSPDTGITSYTYDLAGNRSSQTDANSVTINYSYDALNRLTLVDVPGTADDISYAYDSCTEGVGRLCGVTQGSVTISYAYDVYGNVANVEQGIGTVSIDIDYAYNNDLHMDSVTYPSGVEILYGYDSAGRVSSLALDDGGTTTSLINNISYQPFGSVKGYHQGNGIDATLDFDLDNRIETLTADSILDRDYVYDPAGNVELIGDLVIPTLSRSYSYDDINRLSLEENLSGSAALFDYGYDAVGNRTLYDDGVTSQSLTYGTTNNRLIAIDGQSVTSDNKGNITAMLAFSTVGSLTTDYVYNGLGERVTKQTGSTTRHYFYGANQRLLAEYDDTGSIEREYIYLGGQPVVMLDHTGSGIEIYWIHNDHLGRTLALTDDAGNVVWRWMNGDAFGNAAVIDEDPDNNSVDLTFNLRFPGQYFDSETGLHYNYFRDYDPRTGRYIESDPIGLSGGLNTYLYANTNSVTYLDPYGLLGQGNYGGVRPGPGSPVHPDPVVSVFGCLLGCFSTPINTNAGLQASIEPSIGGGIEICEPKEPETEPKQCKPYEERKKCGDIYDPACDDEIQPPGIPIPTQLGFILGVSVKNDGRFCLRVGLFGELPLPSIELGSAYE